MNQLLKSSAPAAGGNAYEPQKGTNGAGHTFGTEVRPGEKDAQDMRVAIPTWKKVRVTATGLVTGLGAGSVFGGVIVQTSTSLTVTAHDDTAASDATKLLIPVTAALAAGQFVSPFGGGVGAVTANNQAQAGVELTTGLYLTLGGSGSAWVLYR